MEVKIVASTKLDYVAPKKEFDQLGGLTAGVCYLPDTTEKLFSEPQEKTERRIGMTKGSGHHSPYDHAVFTLELVGIPKIVAMTLNNEKMYTTSEKSARYKVMNDVPEDQKKLYNKWLEIFSEEISKKYQATYPEFFTNIKITKLAQENARYLTSIFTPTTMEYTISYRQFNVLYSLIKKEIDRIEKEETSAFYKQYSKALQELATAFESVPYLDKDLFDQKNRSLSLIDRSRRPIVKQYGDVYQIAYLGSFAQLAQAQRHRTISYKLRFLPENKFYVPPILKSDPSLVLEWNEDCQKLAESYPQGLMAEIIEQGTLEKLVLKAKERKCTFAQLEIDNQTTASLLEIYDELEKAQHPSAEELKKYAKKSSRCTFGDYKCISPCNFKEGVLGEREI